MKIEKYVSFRVEKGNTKKVVNQYNHDYRLTSPSYVDPERRNDNVVLRKVDKSFKEMEEYQKEKIKRLTGRSAQKGAELFFSGIMTFSPSMAADYKEKPEAFRECAEQYLKSLETEGFQVLSAVIHLDEKTPHVHLIFDNISEENGKSFRRKVNPNKLRKCQDLMGEAFEPMGYKRGRPVEETRAEHVSSRVFNANTLKEELANVERELSAARNEIDQYQSFIDVVRKVFADGVLDDEEKELLRQEAHHIIKLTKDRKELKHIDRRITKMVR